VASNNDHFLQDRDPYFVGLQINKSMQICYVFVENTLCTLVLITSFTNHPKLNQITYNSDLAFTELFTNNTIVKLAILSQFLKFVAIICNC